MQIRSAEHVDYATVGALAIPIMMHCLRMRRRALLLLHDYATRCTHSVQSYSFYDGRGAVAQTFDNWTSLNGWSTQDVEYDVMGRAYRAGNPTTALAIARQPYQPDGLLDHAHV